MTDIQVTVENAQPINVELGSQSINVEISQSQPIKVDLSEQEINVNLAPQEIKASMADCVVINNLFIQDEQPITSRPTYIWVETETGNIKTFWVETGV